jgi:2',3'-cyclic-nucleotide 2'-phosphodiesterase (5'-nucleotidase family)
LKNERQKRFHKKVSAISGAGLLATAPGISIASFIEKNDQEDVNKDAQPFTLSILQTTDVHCQVHPHDELFWENNKAVFRKTGGYAHLATYLQNERKKNPDSFCN